MDVTRDQYLGILTLNRPDRHNAISDDLFDQFVLAVESLVTDSTIRCILLRAEGRSFCSGRDTAELGKRAPGESDHNFVRRHQDTRLMTVEAPKPVIAAVQGYALGGGFEIALSADIRVAATDAVFALPEIRYGLLPDTGGTQLLTHLVGPARAKYLVLSGNRIDARTALDWGIVDFVVEPGELQSFAHDLAARIAAHDPLPLSLGKQLVDQAHATSFRTGLRQELVAQTALFSSPDYRARKAAANESGKET